MSGWLRTDEYEEIRDTLRACRHFLVLAKSDITYWKWVFIALHNAVQGCMVVALTGTDRFGARNPEQERRWREAYAHREELPREEEKLLSFLKLYEKIKKEGTLQSASVKRFDPQGSQDASMKKLNEVRNEFIHFTPMGWALDLSGADRVVIDCLDVATFLVGHSGRFFIFQSCKEGELLALIDEIKSEFSIPK
jgi:hypothetical protein